MRTHKLMDADQLTPELAQDAPRHSMQRLVRRIWPDHDRWDRLAEALRSIKNELGVPQPEYPAP